MADSSSNAEFPQLKPLGKHADKPAIRIHRPVFMIGSRHSAHLHLLSRQVGKAHALILKDDQGIYLRDLCSRNHVFVNSNQVVEAWLKDGDQIKIGSFTFRLLGNGFDEGNPRVLPEGHLVITGRDGSVPLDERVLLIGRREACNVALDDPTISTEHAVVFAMGGQWYLRDLGSRTGTFLNGQQIHQKALSAGDNIRVGPTEMRFEPTPATGADAAGVTNDLEDLDRLVAAGLGTEDEAVVLQPPQTPSKPAPKQRPAPQPQPRAFTEDPTTESPVEPLGAAEPTAQLPQPLEVVEATEPAQAEPVEPLSPQTEPVSDEESIPLEVAESTPAEPAAKAAEPDEQASQARIDDLADDKSLLIDADLDSHPLNAAASQTEEQKPSSDALELVDESVYYVPESSAIVQAEAPVTLTQPLHDLAEPEETQDDAAQADAPVEPDDDTLPRRGWRRSGVDSTAGIDETSEAVEEVAASEPLEEAATAKTDEPIVEAAVEPPVADTLAEPHELALDTLSDKADAAVPADVEDEAADVEPEDSPVQAIAEPAEVDADEVPKDQIEAATAESADTESEHFAPQAIEESAQSDVATEVDEPSLSADSENADAAIEVLPVASDEIIEPAEPLLAADATAEPVEESPPLVELSKDIVADALLTPPSAPVEEEDGLDLLSLDSLSDDDLELTSPPAISHDIEIEPLFESSPSSNEDKPFELSLPSEVLETTPDEPALTAQSEASAQESPEASDQIELLQPDITEPAAQEQAVQAPELNLDEPEPLAADASQESGAGEFDFSNLTLDLPDEQPEARQETEDLGLEILEPESSSPPPAASALSADRTAVASDADDLGLEILDAEPDPEKPAHGGSAQDEATGPKAQDNESDLLALDALADAMSEMNDPPEAGGDIETPATSTQTSEEPPPDSPKPSRRRTPPRGPDGKFLKRRREKAPRPGAVAAMQDPAAVDQTPAAPAPPKDKPQPQSAQRDQEPASNPRSLLGMGTNIGGFFGGVPLGFDEIPSSGTGADAPAAGRMRHPFDWGATSAFVDAQREIPPYQEPRIDPRGTDFDALAMPPVRQTDVFSQMSAAKLDEALLSGQVADAPGAEQKLDSMMGGKSSGRPPSPTHNPWPAAPPPPPPPPAAPRRRRWFGMGLLLGLMVLSMAAAAGSIWQFVQPQALVQGVLPFDGPQPTVYQQHQQSQLLNDPHTRQAARKILQDERIDGGFLNDDSAYKTFASNAQWSADGFLLTRTGQDMAGDQKRVAALLTALYRSPENQALVDKQANLGRQVEDLTAKEGDAKDALRDLDRQIKTMEENPPPVPTPQEQAAIAQRLIDLKKAWETGTPAPARMSEENWLVAPLMQMLDTELARARASSPNNDTEAQTAYLQTLVRQQKMQTQLAEAKQYQQKLLDKRQQRRAAQSAVQVASQNRAAAQEKKAAALAPRSPALPSAVPLQDPRPTYIALCLGGIALVFMFLILLTLLVGREAAPAAWERPSPTPRPYSNLDDPEETEHQHQDEQEESVHSSPVEV
jgi:pSer/pThr/pTyr-binding forkhead associated (FHA) protein